MSLRWLPQLEAIEEGVSRGAEEGKPVICTPGNFAYLSGMYAPMTIAGMNIFRYTATLCVRKGVRIIGGVPQYPEVISLMDGIFREVCTAEGKPEAYKREDIVYSGNTESSYSIGLQGLIGTYGCSCFIGIGANASSVSTPTGFARLAGAITITGTARWGMQGTFAMFSDYYLAMDDVYSAGALVVEDEVVRSSLIGGDVGKWVSVLIILIGSIAAVVGIPILEWLNI